MAGAPVESRKQEAHVQSSSRAGYNEVVASDYSSGEQCQVWSNSNNAWLTGTVSKAFTTNAIEDNYAVRAGTVKVRSESGLIKYIYPEHVATMLRKIDGPLVPGDADSFARPSTSPLPQTGTSTSSHIGRRSRGRTSSGVSSSEPASRPMTSATEGAPALGPLEELCPEFLEFAVGELIQVWSRSNEAWLDGTIKAMYSTVTRADGYTMAPGTIKVESQAGTKYIYAQSVKDSIRKHPAQHRSDAGDGHGMLDAAMVRAPVPRKTMGGSVDALAHTERKSSRSAAAGAGTESELGHNRGEEAAAKEAELSHREEEVAAKEAELGHREEEVAAKEAELSHREEEVAAKDAELGHREKEALAKEVELDRRAEEVDAKELELRRRAGLIAAKEAEMQRVDMIALQDAERKASLGGEALAADVDTKHKMDEIPSRETEQPQRAHQALAMEADLKKRAGDISARAEQVQKLAEEVAATYAELETSQRLAEEIAVREAELQRLAEEVVAIYAEVKGSQGTLSTDMHGEEAGAREVELNTVTEDAAAREDKLRELIEEAAEAELQRGAEEVAANDAELRRAEISECTPATGDEAVVKDVDLKMREDAAVAKEAELQKRAEEAIATEAQLQVREEHLAASKADMQRLGEELATKEGAIEASLAALREETIAKEMELERREDEIAVKEGELKRRAQMQELSSSAGRVEQTSVPTEPQKRREHAFASQVGTQLPPANLQPVETWPDLPVLAPPPGMWMPSALAEMPLDVNTDREDRALPSIMAAGGERALTTAAVDDRVLTAIVSEGDGRALTATMADSDDRVLASIMTAVDNRELARPVAAGDDRTLTAIVAEGVERALRAIRADSDDRALTSIMAAVDKRVLTAAVADGGSQSLPAAVADAIVPDSEAKDLASTIDDDTGKAQARATEAAPVSTLPPSAPASTLPRSSYHSDAAGTLPTPEALQQKQPLEPNVGSLPASVAAAPLLSPEVPGKELVAAVEQQLTVPPADTVPVPVTRQSCASKGLQEADGADSKPVTTELKSASGLSIDPSALQQSDALKTLAREDSESQEPQAQAQTPASASASRSPSLGSSRGACNFEETAPREAEAQRPAAAEVEAAETEAQRPAAAEVEAAETEAQRPAAAEVEAAETEAQRPAAAEVEAAETEAASNEESESTARLEEATVTVNPAAAVEAPVAAASASNAAVPVAITAADGSQQDVTTLESALSDDGDDEERRAIVGILEPLLLRELPAPWQVRKQAGQPTTYFHAGAGELREHHPLKQFFREMMDFLRVSAQTSEPMPALIAQMVSTRETNPQLVRERLGVWKASEEKAGLFERVWLGTDGACPEVATRSDDPRREAAANIEERLRCWRHIWRGFSPEEPFPVPDDQLGTLAAELGEAVLMPPGAATPEVFNVMTEEQTSAGTISPLQDKKRYAAGEDIFSETTNPVPHEHSTDEDEDNEDTAAVEEKEEGDERYSDDSPFEDDFEEDEESNGDEADDEADDEAVEEEQVSEVLSEDEELGSEKDEQEEGPRLCSPEESTRPTPSQPKSTEPEEANQATVQAIMSEKEPRENKPEEQEPESGRDVQTQAQERELLGKTVEQSAVSTDQAQVDETLAQAASLEAPADEAPQEVVIEERGAETDADVEPFILSAGDDAAAWAQQALRPLTPLLEEKEEEGRLRERPLQKRQVRGVRAGGGLWGAGRGGGGSASSQRGSPSHSATSSWPPSPTTEAASPLAKGPSAAALAAYERLASLLLTKLRSGGLAALLGEEALDAEPAVPAGAASKEELARLEARGALEKALLENSDGDEVAEPAAAAHSQREQLAEVEGNEAPLQQPPAEHGDGCGSSDSSMKSSGLAFDHNLCEEENFEEDEEDERGNRGDKLKHVERFASKTTGVMGYEEDFEEEGFEEEELEEDDLEEEQDEQSDKEQKEKTEPISLSDPAAFILDADGLAASASLATTNEDLTELQPEQEKEEADAAALKDIEQTADKEAEKTLHSSKTSTTTLHSSKKKESGEQEAEESGEEENYAHDYVAQQQGENLLGQEAKENLELVNKAPDEREHMKTDAEEKARKDAAAAEEQDTLRQDAAERMGQEAEAQAKLAEEQRLRLQAEEKARKEAEEKARLEEEERSRLQSDITVAEEALPLQEEERLRQEAEEKDRKEAEEIARLEEEERSRLQVQVKKAEEALRLEGERLRQEVAEETLRLEEEERLRHEAEEKARTEAEEKKAQLGEEKPSRLQAEMEAAEEAPRLDQEECLKQAVQEEHAKHEAEEASVSKEVEPDPEPSHASPPRPQKPEFAVPAGRATSELRGASPVSGGGRGRTGSRVATPPREAGAPTAGPQPHRGGERLPAAAAKREPAYRRGPLTALAPTRGIPVIQSYPHLKGLLAQHVAEAGPKQAPVTRAAAPDHSSEEIDSSTSPAPAPAGPMVSASSPSRHGQLHQYRARRRSSAQRSVELQAQAAYLRRPGELQAEAAERSAAVAAPVTGRPEKPERRHAQAGLAAAAAAAAADRPSPPAERPRRAGESKSRSRSNRSAKEREQQIHGFSFMEKHAAAASEASTAMPRHLTKPLPASPQWVPRNADAICKTYLTPGMQRLAQEGSFPVPMSAVPTKKNLLGGSKRSQKRSMQVSVSLPRLAHRASDPVPELTITAPAAQAGSPVSSIGSSPSMARSRMTKGGTMAKTTPDLRAVAVPTGQRPTLTPQWIADRVGRGQGTARSHSSSSEFSPERGVQRSSPPKRNGAGGRGGRSADAASNGSLPVLKARSEQKLPQQPSRGTCAAEYSRSSAAGIDAMAGTPFC